MGYTHYWYVNDIPRPIFKKILKDFMKLPGWEDELADGNGIGQPKANSSRIIFNGKNERSHETFVIGVKAEGSQSGRNRLAFNFCKTARKEYDVYVTACLMICRHFLGADINVHSDGDDSEWNDGRKLMKEAGLDYWDSYHFTKKEDEYELDLVGKVRIESTKEDNDAKESAGT